MHSICRLSETVCSPAVTEASPDTGRDEVADLLPQVYDQLRAVAGARLRRERGDHTLQATALVHEAFLRLVEQTRVVWKGRRHFFAVAAEAIRRVLVDHARARRAGKRLPPGARLGIDTIDVTESGPTDLLELDQALQRLAALDPRRARVVELRYFGGCSIEETAEALEVSLGTVKGDWRLARAWLQRELAGSAAA